MSFLDAAVKDALMPTGGSIGITDRSLGFLGNGAYGVPNPLFSGASPIGGGFQFPVGGGTVSFGQPFGIATPKVDSTALRDPNSVEPSGDFPGGSALFLLGTAALVAFLILK